jgi:peptide/nickel transport system permease protein
MASYLVSRMAQSLVLLVLVSMIGFGVLHLAPGGPLAQFALVPGMSQAQLAEVAHAMGLDQPLPVQYWQWFARLVAGDWGHSYRDSQPVLAVIAARLPATLELMVAAISLAVLAGVTIGVLGAVRRHSVFDTLSTAGAMVALSIPTFWFGLVTIYLFSVKLGWLPAGNRSTVGDETLLGYAHHLVAPACVLALVEVAVWSRYMRSAMLDVIDQDFVRTARAKGLPERRVILHHVFRNALLPMITLAGVNLPTLLGGALVTETVFTWPGMGRLFLDSLGYRDYPVVMGILMVSALLVLVGSLLADLFGALADPRVRLD